MSFHWLGRRQPELANISVVAVEMDDRLDLELVVNDANMSADCDVTMIARRRRQLTPEVRGGCVHFIPKVLVKNSTFMQAGFLVGREAVLVSKPGWGMILVLIVPIVCDLTILVVKLRMSLVVPLFAILRDSRIARKRENRHGSCEQRQVCFHVISLPVISAGMLVKKHDMPSSRKFHFCLNR
jgi:hypothetical protein